MRFSENLSWTLWRSFFEPLFRGAFKVTFGWTHELGRILVFGYLSLRYLFRQGVRKSELLKHIEFIGIHSILIILITSLFTGMALSFQIYLGYKWVNMTSLVGPTVGLAIAREMGPVLTALIVAARAGGAMAARLATMRVSEQMDAMEVMGFQPLEYLVLPRIVAAVLCLPLLTAIFDFVAMAGCYVVMVIFFATDEAGFWDRVSAWLQPNHLNEGYFKAAVFGLIFAVVCCYRGFNARGGAKGVGEATNKGVVISMVMIIVIDYFLTNLIRVFYVLQRSFT